MLSLKISFCSYLIIFNFLFQNTFVYAYSKYHIVIKGDSYWKISSDYKVKLHELMSYNKATDKTILHIGDKILIPIDNDEGKVSLSNNVTVLSPKGSVTRSNRYYSYIVKEGDSLEKISRTKNVPISKILNLNRIENSHIIYEGQLIKLPNSDVPDLINEPILQNSMVEPSLISEQHNQTSYGEYIDWWKEGKNIMPRETKFEIIDFYTKKSFNAIRSCGENHMDVETLTSKDTAILKEIWGGQFSWNRRPILIKLNGRLIAASALGMPHAGSDKEPSGSILKVRSGGYGEGSNLDWIKNNDMDGVFCIHLLNSTRHLDNLVDEAHQDAIKIAAGIK